MVSLARQELTGLFFASDIFAGPSDLDGGASGGNEFFHSFPQDVHSICTAC